METQDRINALESRQLALQALMARSDAHAAKCIKLGLPFAETYPDELAAYQEARDEYNDNEAALERLFAAREQEMAEEAAAIRPDEPIDN